MTTSLAHLNSVSHRLRSEINRRGAITFRDWMEAALYDHEGGYYTKGAQQIWGRHGDYRTSPERSALFAATFARYFAKLYVELGSPQVFTIVEAGGGDGSFASVAVKTLRDHFPDVFTATHFIFDERSNNRNLELLNYGSFDRLDEIQIENGVVFSNELIDAFPVHRVKATGGQLLEYYVDVDDRDEFAWRLLHPSTPELEAYLVRYKIELREGQSCEINLEAEKWIEMAASKLERGFIITVDYGAEANALYTDPERFEGTLRSFSRHAFVEDLLQSPGDNDLTATINWTALRGAGERAGLKTILFEPQSKFLLEEGLLEQLGIESRNLNAAERLCLATSAREMILPGGMAEKFQVLVQQKS